MQALRPLHRHLVPAGRRDEAERRVLQRRAVPLTVVIHLPTQLAVQLRILTRHVVGGVGGAGVDHARLPGLDGRRLAEALMRIGGGEDERLAAGGGERVPHGREDEDEEEEDEAEERRRDDVQHAPLARAAHAL